MVGDSFIPIKAIQTMINPSSPVLVVDTFSNLTDSKGGVFGLSEKGIAWEWEYAKVANTKYKSDDDGVYRTIMPPPEWTKYNGYFSPSNSLYFPLLGLI